MDPALQQTTGEKCGLAPIRCAATPKATDKGREHAGELHGEDELGGGTFSQLLQRLKVLQAHGPGVRCPGHRVDLHQSERNSRRVPPSHLHVDLG